MQKIYRIIIKNKLSIILLVIVFSVFLVILIKNHTKEVESFTVARTNVSQSVLLSGKVSTVDKADLGFATGGRINSIFVKNNQIVKEGTTLAQLEIGDLLADLKIKQINSRISEIDLEAAQEELKRITTQENTKVENSYRTLLTEDLELVPDSSNYDVVAPVVGGIYNGPEGKYKIYIEKNSNTTEFTVRTFGLEKTQKLINEKGSTVLGSKGLYISFPNNLELYHDTTWFLDIPNKGGVSYLLNYNNYNEAKNNRDLAIKKAETDYQKLLSEDDGSISIAQAEIDKIKAEIKKSTISAPFTGEVTSIGKEVGESVSIGDRVITMLGKEKLEVILQVSELDVSKLNIGMSIKITLDAFPDEVFEGVLKNINSKETKIDGVPIYEAFVELPSDPRIKTGMTANGTVVLQSKENVLTIPVYVVKKLGEKNIVEVLNTDGSTKQVEVILGLIGSDNTAEIISGLDEGEKVVLNSNKK